MPAYKNALIRYRYKDHLTARMRGVYAGKIETGP